MLFLFLSFSFCNNFEQIETIKKGLSEFQKRIDKIRSDMENISERIESLEEKLNNANETVQKIKENYNKVKESTNKIKSELINTTEGSLNKIFYSNVKSIPKNLSLVSFSSDLEHKSIDFPSLLQSKLIPSFNSPSYLPDGNGFYQIKGREAKFTFLSHQIERISKISINQTHGNKCGIKTFKIKCTDHNSVFESEIFNAQMFSDKPQVFYLNRSIWVKSLVLHVIDNFGDDHICLPQVLVYDNDFYYDSHQ